MRVPYDLCSICGGGIRSSSLYSGKCVRCRNAEKKLKRLKKGEIVNINKNSMIKQIMRDLQ